MTVRPFAIETPDAALADLMRRIERTRWPGEIPGSRWDYGAEPDYMRELAGYWRTGFDWRRQERMLNELDQFKAEIDGQEVHFVRVRGRGPNPVPLLLLHGWPSTFFEFYKVIGPLADPAAHGGDPADAFDVVVPSMPGYGFSDHPTKPGMHVLRVSDLWAKLMTEGVGYNMFLGSNGTIKTPKDTSILQGVSRSFVFDLARQLNIPIVEEDLQPYDLYTADESFFSSTPFCVLPVTTVDKREIGDGEPGPIFKQLLSAWSEHAGLDIWDQAQRQFGKLGGGSTVH